MKDAAKQYKGKVVKKAKQFTLSFRRRGSESLKAPQTSKAGSVSSLSTAGDPSTSEDKRSFQQEGLGSEHFVSSPTTISPTTPTIVVHADTTIPDPSTPPPPPPSVMRRLLFKNQTAPSLAPSKSASTADDRSSLASGHGSTASLVSNTPHSTSTTLKNLAKISLGALHSVLDGLPIPGAKGIVEIALKVIGTFEAIQANDDARFALDERCTNLMNAIVRVLKGTESQIAGSLKQSLERLAGGLYNLYTELTNYNPGLIDSMINTEDEQGVLKKINDSIIQLLEIFLLESHITGAIASHDILTSIGRGADAMEKHALHQQIQTLPRVRAGFDSYLDEDNKRFTCLEGTRHQLLGEIADWIASTDRCPIYVLYGIAGIGKTTVAQTVAERTFQLGRLGASFFFSRAEDDRKSAKKFFSTVSFQLSCFDKDFATCVGAALEQTPDAAQKTLEKQLQLLVVGPLRKSQALKAKLQPIVLVFDAFDECEENESTEVLKLLAQAVQQLPNLRILITTRPESHLRKAIHSQGYHECFYLHEIEKAVVEADISLYLHHHLSVKKIQEVQPGSQWSPTPKDLDILIQAAGRFFIIASTTIRFILNSKWYKPQSQMDRLTQALKTNKDMAVMTAMDSMYIAILQSALPGESDPELEANFQTVLGTILALENPLAMEALGNLLNMDVEEIDRILQFLHSVIAPTSKDRAPQVYHKSFPDFVTDPARCKDPRFLIFPGQHHAHIAAACLGLMQRNLCQNICQLGRSERYMSNADNAYLTKGKISQELAYACTYWATHLKNAEYNDESCLIGLVQDFAFAHLLHWMEVLSLIGKLDTAVPALRNAEQFLANTSKNLVTPELSEVLNDGQRLVTKFYSTITKSALHVYYSALPFAPSQSLLYRTYSDTVLDRVTVVQGQSKRWKPLLSILTGHSNKVDCVAFSPDGTRLASGSWDSNLWLWSCATGAPIATLEGHSDVVTSLAFSDNGSILASGSDDCTVRLWDGVTGAPMTVLHGHSDIVTSVAFSGNKLASGSEDHDVNIWDISTGTSIITLEGHADRVSCIAFSTDGSIFASGSDDYTVRLWDGITGTYIATLIGHTNMVASVAFSSKNSKLASASWDRSVRLWNSTNGALITIMEGHTDIVTTVSFSSDGSRLASGSWDNDVRLWDGDTGALIAILQGHSGGVTSVVFSADSSRLASGCWDKTVRLWDGVAGTPLSVMDGHSDVITTVAFSYDGSSIASSSCDHTIGLWDGITKPVMTTSMVHSDIVTSLAYSVDGSRLASGNENGELWLWNTITGEYITALEGHSAQITSITFSANGSRIASGSWDKLLNLWDGDTGKSIASIEFHSDVVVAVAFSFGDERLASASWDHTIGLWKGLTGEPIATLKGHSGAVESIAFSADGSMLASGAWDNTVRLWNGITGEYLDILQGHSKEVTCVEFSVDGSTLVSVSSDNTILWDVSTSTPLASLKDYSEILTPIEVSINSPTSTLSTNAVEKKGDTHSPTTVAAGKIIHSVPPFCVQNKTGGVFHHSEKAPLCWIPAELLEVTCTASTRSSFAAGCVGGEVIILDMKSMQPIQTNFV